MLFLIFLFIHALKSVHFQITEKMPLCGTNLHRNIQYFYAV